MNLESPDDLKSGVIYFDGQWVVWPEHTRHGRDTIGYEDALSLVYSSRSLNVVVFLESGQLYTVRITLNGDFLTDEDKGSDVPITANGESFLSVNEPKMYRIIEAPAYSKDNNLTMSPNSDDFEMFAFTFGVYETGP